MRSELRIFAKTAIDFMTKNPEIRLIGQNIRKIRELRSLNQEYVADALGISLRTYGKSESQPEYITLDNLFKIADILTIPAARLLNMNMEQLFQHNQISGLSVQGNAYNHDPTVIKEGYDLCIQHLKNEINYLRGQVDRLKTK